MTTAVPRRAAQVHDSYRRHVAGAPFSGRPVELGLRVDGFYCDNDGCRAKAFAERVPGLTTP